MSQADKKRKARHFFSQYLIRRPSVAYQSAGLSPCGRSNFSADLILTHSATAALDRLNLASRVDRGDRIPSVAA